MRHARATAGCAYCRRAAGRTRYQAAGVAFGCGGVARASLLSGGAGLACRLRVLHLQPACVRHTACSGTICAGVRFIGTVTRPALAFICVSAAGVAARHEPQARVARTVTRWRASRLRTVASKVLICCRTCWQQTVHHFASLMLARAGEFAWHGVTDAPAALYTCATGSCVQLPLPAAHCLRSCRLLIADAVGCSGARC